MPKAETLIEKIRNNEYQDRFIDIYVDHEKASKQNDRYIAAINEFTKLFSDDIEAVFSAPGRSEIGGNHTDHQHGEVLAASINDDAIAIVAKTDKNEVNILSKGYDMITISLDELDKKDNEVGTTHSLIRGVIAKTKANGHIIGGFDAYVTSNVLSGSGLSSSAAFETLIGTILSGLYNDMSISAIEIAIIGQYAENVYFGKPCGLMDQMAASVGGFVSIDFKDIDSPIIDHVNVDFDSFGHALCIIDTKGDPDDISEEYIAIRSEMHEIAEFFSVDSLRQLCKHDIILNINLLRERFGDRAVLRAIHFFEENKRVDKLVNALRRNDFQAFLDSINESGNSSYKYLQNVYSSKDIVHQGLSVGLNIAEYALGRKGATRVHGAGFAGTIQAFVPFELLKEFKMELEKVFGNGSCHVLKIRPVGGCEVTLESLND